MTAIKPDRHFCARGGRYAIGVVCLVVGLCCTGCGKKQESSPNAPATVDAAASRGKGAARPAAKAPRPVAAVEKPAPAPAESAAEVVAEKPKVVVNESAIVARKPAPAVERTETLEQIVDATVEETVIAAAEPAPAAKEPARVIAAEPVETPFVEAVEPSTASEPEHAADHAGLATAAMEQGDCERALEHFHYARQESPDDLELRLNEARTYRHCGWPDVSLELLSELDARSRALEPVAAEIAEAHRMLNEPGRAAMAWELRYIHHPRAWRAAAHAAQAWMEAGQHRPAQWWFEQARLAAPNTPEVQALTTVIQSASVTTR